MKNYLKLAIRNLLRKKEYFFINVFGLAVGMACAIMVLVYVWKQANYDNFHPHSDRLYRLCLSSKLGGLVSNVALTSPMFANGLNPQIPEIDQACRIFKSDQDLLIAKPSPLVFEGQTLLYVDSTFFDLFGFKLLEGDPKLCFTKPYSIVLPRSTANRLFPEGAIGKTLTLEKDRRNGEQEKGVITTDRIWTVTGIVQDAPTNSHLQYKALVSLSSIEMPHLQWTSHFVYTYYRFKEGTDLNRTAEPSFLDLTAMEDKFMKAYLREAGDEIEKSMGITIEEMRNQDEYFVLRLQKVTDIHLFSQLKYEISPNVNINTILIIVGITVLIIMIACINYANLTTARLASRVREIGIRKLLGSQRRELANQLMAESVLISFISLFFALVLVELIYPNTVLVNQGSDSDLHILLFKLSPIIFCVTLFIGIIAGVYPAFYILRFSPAAILRQQKHFSAGGKGLRGILVIIQFVFSIVIIYSTSTIYRQLRYVQTKGVGFEKERLLVIQNNDAIKRGADLFKNKINQISEVENVSYSNAVPGKLLGMQSFQNGNNRNNNLLMYVMKADSSFIRTYGMSMLPGSRPLRQYQSPDSVDVIVNEEAIKYLGIKNPIDAALKRIDSDTVAEYLMIRGVVENFNFESLHTNVQPLVIFPDQSDSAKFVTLRMKTAVNRALQWQIHDLCKSVCSDAPFYLFSMNDHLKAYYQEEQFTGQVAVAFSFFAIFIACMGLYSLLALTTIYRTKEIGIRKVLGAGTRELFLLLSKEIFILIVIAGIIALPIAFLISHYWLDRFAYHVILSFSNYLLVFAAVLVVAVFTVYRQLCRTINADPGNVLRME